jgi:signal transduction histidine kinase
LTVEVTGDGSDRKLDNERRVLLFRVSRELLFNVVKHAGAKRVRMSLSGNEDMVLVKISDDGTGICSDLLQAGYDPMERGFGLFSIREQLTQYNGTFEIDSNPGRGSSVTIALPLKPTTEPKKEVSP